MRFEIPHEELARYLPIRVVMRKADDGQLVGITEETFNLNTSRERVNIFWSGKAYSLLGEHILNGETWAKGNLKPGDILIDPLAPDSPIEINWRYWLDAMKAGVRRKYDSRNAPFFEKETEK